MREPNELDAVIRDTLDEVLAQHEPVPAAVRTYARAVFALRSLDAELARLVIDTPVSVRAGAERYAIFESGGLTLELRDAVETPDVLGRLDPPAPGQFLVRTSQQGQGGDITSDGLFQFERPTAVFSLRLVIGDRVVDTDPLAW